jgi:hypothetical protein
VRAAILILSLSLAALACGSDPAGGGGSGGSTSQGGDGGGGSGGSGRSLNCLDLLYCVDGCNDNAACQEKCVDDSTEEGLTKARDYAQCYLDYRCEKASCEPCATKLTVCVRDGLTALSCGSLQACIGVCAGDAACEQDVCRSRAVPGAEEALQAYEACLSAAGCAADDSVCIQQFCKSEQTDCFG